MDPVNGRWSRPPPGYCKLNGDGSVRDGMATYGAILRDDQGTWLWEFTGCCGRSTPLATELSAIKEGLLALHRHGFMRVIMEIVKKEGV